MTTLTMMHSSMAIGHMIMRVTLNGIAHTRDREAAHHVRRLIACAAARMLTPEQYMQYIQENAFVEDESEAVSEKPVTVPNGAMSVNAAPTGRGMLYPTMVIDSSSGMVSFSSSTKKDLALSGLWDAKPTKDYIDRLSHLVMEQYQTDSSYRSSDGSFSEMVIRSWVETYDHVMDPVFKLSACEMIHSLTDYVMSMTLSSTKRAQIPLINKKNCDEMISVFGISPEIVNYLEFATLYDVYGAFVENSRMFAIFVRMLAKHEIPKELSRRFARRGHDYSLPLVYTAFAKKLLAKSFPEEMTDVNEGFSRILKVGCPLPTFAGNMAGNGPTIFYVKNNRLYIKATELTGTDRYGLCSKKSIRDRIEDGSLGGKCVGSIRTRDDFRHIEDFDTISKLLNAAVKKKRKGINVLIVGSAGTGKSEIVPVLCQEHDLHAYFTGERTDKLSDMLHANSKDADGDVNSYNRVYDITAALYHRARIRDGVVVVDEADDILANNNIDIVSKHRLLETNKVPVVWITNHPERLTHPILRRMTYILRMDTPDKATRKRIFETVLAEKNIHLASDTLERFIDTYNPKVSDIVSAATTAKIIDRKMSHLEDILRSTATYGTPAKTFRKSTEKKFEFLSNYDVTATNSDEDIVQLSKTIVEDRITNFSLCIHGPSGTGKSAFARYLAQQLHMEVLFKNASDLLGMYVGESEKAIAGAFAEAEAMGKFLIFDEADSLLRDRKYAHQTWEVSQVNTMLQCMEDMKTPFVCTTNLVNQLDAASLRRFTFKMKFDYLQPKHISVVFKKYFGYEPSREILSMTNLTPADISLTYKKLSILRKAYDLTVVAEHLRKECEAKPDATNKNPIGFGR